MIEIGDVYLENASEDKVRLCADITRKDKTKQIWFETDKRYADYLTTERSDAFVFALLTSALKSGEDIVCRVPVSRRLLDQLNFSLIPVLSGVSDFYHPVEVIAPAESCPLDSTGETGMAVTCGVDSFYTLKKHMESERKIDRLCFFNAVAFDKFGNDYRKIFEETAAGIKEFANEIGLDLIIVDTNFKETLGEKYTNEFFFYRNIACALALQKLFSCFWLSAEFFIGDFDFNIDHCGLFAPIIQPNAGTETMSFFLEGMDKTRYEKTEEISMWEPAYKWFHACVSPTAPGKKNCGECWKCKLAMLTLWSLGRLENFSSVYDLDGFEERLPHLLFYARNKELGSFKDLVKKMEESGTPVPENITEKVRRLERAYRHFRAGE